VRRLLIVVIVLYVVWRILGIIGRRIRGEGARERVAGGVSRGDEPDRRAKEARQLVPCSRCGTLVPEDRALLGPGGERYCKSSCLEAVRAPTRQESGDEGGELPPPPQRA